MGSRDAAVSAFARRTAGSNEIGKWPLSVSADSIAMCAMRAATL